MHSTFWLARLSTPIIDCSDGVLKDATPWGDWRSFPAISALPAFSAFPIGISNCCRRLTTDGLITAYAGKHRERAAYRWSVDFTAYLAPEGKGRGIGTELYCSLVKICQSLGYYRAFAGITLPNEASVRLHEKIGFRPIGVYRRVGFKLGKWHDVGWWSLDLLPEEDAPGEPRSIWEISGSGELEMIFGVKAEHET